MTMSHFKFKVTLYSAVCVKYCTISCYNKCFAFFKKKKYFVCVLKYKLSKLNNAKPS